MNWKESSPQPKICVINSDKCAGLRVTHVLVHGNGTTEQCHTVQWYRQ